LESTARTSSLSGGKDARMYIAPQSIKAMINLIFPNRSGKQISRAIWLVYRTAEIFGPRFVRLDMRPNQGFPSCYRYVSVITTGGVFRKLGTGVQHYRHREALKSDFDNFGLEASIDRPVSPPSLAHSAPWRVTDLLCCSRPAEGRQLASLPFVSVVFATYPLG